MNLAHRAIAAVSILVLALGVAHALPIVVSPAPVPVKNAVSTYQDGYTLGTANAPTYLYFRENLGGTWGAWTELRIDENPALADPAFLQSVSKGTVQLDEWGTGANVFAGDASQLKVHSGNYGWSYGYDIGFGGAYVDVDLQIQFDWSESAIADRKIQLAKELEWEYAMERWWTAADAKVLVSVAGDGTFAYPISFDVTRTGYNDGAPHNQGIYDQVVTVWDPLSADPNKPGRANMTNWFETSDAQTVAHEFGHMLGAFDEYWGGGINTMTWVTDYANLMGSSNPLASPQGMKPLYYEPFKLWLANDDPIKTNVYRLLVPEPDVLLLLLIGAAVMRCVPRTNCGT